MDLSSLSVWFVCFELVWFLPNFDLFLLTPPFASSEAGTSRTSSGGDSASSSGTHAKENNNRTEPEMTGQDGNGTGNGEKPVHKWPIRPGVHVHVNGLHPLNKSGSSSGGRSPGSETGPDCPAGSKGSTGSLNRSVNRGTSTASDSRGGIKSKHTKAPISDELRHKGELFKLPLIKCNKKT